MVADKSPVLDRMFHALSHPARRAILRRLAAGELNLTDLSAPLRMSFPAATKHVRVLERARLVRRRKSGRACFCRLDAAPLKELARFADGYRRFWDKRFQALDRVLDEMQRGTK